ncbi:1-acyl-sn-glycerol-3-phosphate acyltransferase [Clostridium sp. D2Q-14]|uniref:lysophospholipid acyltransferase family protein n=1 Tax=Anaeromonas gelatinilytica TaxID=2683194 RepID=UPI00193C2F12|nr:lysophospholipid acyltransferase family protein [Anaeromonas gelatinilytica]MBS4536255.1 1-acyl-sn-glycerol-3-phosphate acyltransferase [Anaeromonas gelatinilytica]
MSFYNFIRNLASVVFNFFYKIKIHGDKNILKDSKVLICSNHTHDFDPIILGIVFNTRQIHFMAKKELFKYKLAALFMRKLGAFPIDRNGADLSAIKKALKLLKSNKALGIFPEGTRVKRGMKGKAKSGIAMIAIKSKAPVLPVYIDTNYKIFSKVDVYIGQPIDLSKEKKGKLNMEDYKSLSDNIINEIYDLK